MHDYNITVCHSPEDGGYIADLPDLKFCSAFGKTPEEAVRELQIAKKAWLETCRARGKPIPKPLYRPAIYAVGAAGSPKSKPVAKPRSRARAPLVPA